MKRLSPAIRARTKLALQKVITEAELEELGYGTGDEKHPEERCIALNPFGP